MEDWLLGVSERDWDAHFAWLKERTPLNIACYPEPVNLRHEGELEKEIRAPAEIAVFNAGEDIIVEVPIPDKVDVPLNCISRSKSPFKLLHRS